VGKNNKCKQRNNKLRPQLSAETTYLFMIYQSIACFMSLVLGWTLVLSDTSQSPRYPRPSVRSNIPSFKVMDVVARAAVLEAEGRTIFHLEVGQPNSAAPPEVCDAARAAIATERLGYTPGKPTAPVSDIGL
jgi:hypothetical protein